MEYLSLYSVINSVTLCSQLRLLTTNCAFCSWLSISALTLRSRNALLSITKVCFLPVSVLAASMFFTMSMGSLTPVTLLWHDSWSQFGNCTPPNTTGTVRIIGVSIQSVE